MEMEKIIERIKEVERGIRKREKIMERIIDTEANSAERAHVVEAYINEELSFNDLNMNSMYSDRLQQLKKRLKNVQYYADVCYLIDETSRFIKALAEEFSEEKGGE